MYVTFRLVAWDNIRYYWRVLPALLFVIITIIWAHFFWLVYPAFSGHALTQSVYELVRMGGNFCLFVTGIMYCSGALRTRSWGDCAKAIAGVVGSAWYLIVVLALSRLLIDLFASPEHLIGEYSDLVCTLVAGSVFLWHRIISFFLLPLIALGKAIDRPYQRSLQLIISERWFLLHVYAIFTLVWLTVFFVGGNIVTMIKSMVSCSIMPCWSSNFIKSLMLSLPAGPTNLLLVSMQVRWFKKTIGKN